MNGIIRAPDLDFVPDPKGVGFTFFNQMKKHGDKVVQIDVLTGEKDMYSSLLRRCIRTALTMRSKGIGQEDVVMLCTHNHLNSCVPFFASIFAGAIVASLDPTLSLNDIVHLVNQVRPKMIFVAPEVVDLIEKATVLLKIDPEIVVFGATLKHVPFDHFLKPFNDEERFRPHEVESLNETVIVFFSSGTSGLPKGICISHLTYLGQIEIGLNFGQCVDRILAFASLYWVTSVSYWGIALNKGTTRLIAPKFNSNEVWELIDIYKPTILFLAPSQAVATYKSYPAEHQDVYKLKHITIGGGAMSTEQVREMRKLLPHTDISLVYGQTEILGFTTGFKVNDPKHLKLMEKYPASSGTALPSFTYKIIDLNTGELLGPNQTGEIRVKTKYQLTGYYNQPSSDIWDSEGWLKTGDVAYYNEDGCFFVVDRIKEMLKYQSFHVLPASLENVLLTHPDIAQALVMGLPHEIDGDHPMAVVTLKGSSNLTEREIIEYVDERVHERQRLRGGVKIVKNLPLTPSGKIRRRAVKEMMFRELKLGKFI